MINLEDFEKFDTIKSIIEKINKYYSKNKHEKVRKLLDQLIDRLEVRLDVIPITYLFSIIAEKDINLISDTNVTIIAGFLDSKDDKLLLNSITSIGFAILNNNALIEIYLPRFIEFLVNENKDIKENVYFFLQQISKDNPNSLCNRKSSFIEILKQEESDKNIITIINILKLCSDFSFSDLYLLRNILRDLYSKYFEQENEIMLGVIDEIAKNLYPELNKIEEFNSLEIKEKLKVLDETFIMRKEVFGFDDRNKLNKKIEILKNSEFREEMIYFYIKNKEKKIISVYTFEKEKLLDLFSLAKSSNEELLEIFNQIIQDISELNSLISFLLKFKYIDGYYSDLGYFYPILFMTNEFQQKFQEKGMINLKSYDYFPPNFIEKVVEKISSDSKQVYLRGKNNVAFYALRSIVDQINKEAAKNSSIDLKSYQQRLAKNDYKKLVKNLPRDYLTEYHKETFWLTNLGLLRIKQEIENSKILGYLSIPDIIEKHNISKTLLIELIEKFVDLRSGVFDINKEIFFYSKYLKTKIDKLNLIESYQVKKKRINQLARKLNIKKDHILSKIDENLQLIGEEIKNKEELSISIYLEKTGLKEKEFLKFIEELGIDYFRKEDLLVLGESKINDAKMEIKKLIIQKCSTEKNFSLGNFDISLQIVSELLSELLREKKVRGILYEQDDNMLFYTEKGIRDMMMEESFLFSLLDFFPEKELSKEEIEILRSILDELMNSKTLNGTFDEESLTFSSNDVIFAQNYNVVVSEFEKIVTDYNSKFLAEFEKIKNILTKKDQNILPQEIKTIQDSLKQINAKYIKWRHELDAFVRRANSELLKKQGFTIKRYKEMMRSTDYKMDVKMFEEDDDVKKLITQFQDWIKLFNNIELKYGNVIFYQKRMIRDPSDSTNEEKLDHLLNELHLI